MAPTPAAIRCSGGASGLLLVLFFLLIQPSISIYCDEDDCYDLLGFISLSVSLSLCLSLFLILTPLLSSLLISFIFLFSRVSQSANSSEIKKAYYKLSLKYHPDKNPDPDSRKFFVKIANAYEILKDEATREQYDYAIAHPEEVFYNTARYYHAYYGHKTDARAVLVGLLLVLSAFQYLNQWTRYNQAIDMVKKTPAYKNRLHALELERSGGMTNKKKGQKPMDKKMTEDLSKELDLQITGAEKPSMWELLGVRFILLPYTIGKLLLWHACWLWRYQVKRAPHSWEDASYLTRRSLGASLDKWRSIDESTQEDLIQRRLWEKSNLESYLAEMRKESKRRR